MTNHDYVIHVSPDDLATLRARFVADAASAGLVDIAYRIHPGPVGDLLLAATPAGLVRVAFASEGPEAVLQELAERVSPRVLDHPERLDAVARQLDEYYAGRRHVFDLALDWQLSAGFRRTVLDHLLTDVVYGTTASYTSLAQMSGSPRAVRAVGTACATNPIPVVVPCHRVVRSDGSPGRYRGGEEAKLALLELESA